MTHQGAHHADSNAFVSRQRRRRARPPRSTCRTRAPNAFALFAHCFTCSKDNLAARRIAAALAGARHRGAAVRLHRARHERRRIRQFDVLVQRRRSGARRRSSAQNPSRAVAADRPQPRRRRGAGRRSADSGGEGGGDHRRAVRSGACHRTVRRRMSTPSAAKAASRSRSPAGRSPSSANFSTTSPNTICCAQVGDAAQGAADPACADRRHRRHRQCHADFRRRQASEKFRVAGRRRSSADRPPRRRLCRRPDRAPGPSAISISPPQPAAPGDVDAPRRVVVRETGSGKFQQHDRARPASPASPTSRCRPAATTPVPAPTTCCWPRSAPAPR